MDAPWHTHTHILHPRVPHLIIRKLFEVLYVCGAHYQTLRGKQIVPPFYLGALMKPSQGSYFDNHWSKLTECRLYLYGCPHTQIQANPVWQSSTVFTCRKQILVSIKFNGSVLPGGRIFSETMFSYSKPCNDLICWQSYLVNSWWWLIL